MKETSTKCIEILSAILSVVFVGFIIYLSLEPRENTQCIDEFLHGYISAEGMLSDCPDVTKEEITGLVKKTYPDHAFRRELLADVEKTYWTDGEFEKAVQELK